MSYHQLRQECRARASSQVPASPLNVFRDHQVTEQKLLSDNPDRRESDMRLVLTGFINFDRPMAGVGVALAALKLHAGCLATIERARP